LGGYSGNLTAGHQKYGISIGPAGGGAVVNGVRLGTNDTNPVLVDASATAVTIQNCPGMSDSVPSSVTRATTITLPVRDAVPIAGDGGNIQTINGGWDNRDVTLLAVGGFAFVTGGNIAAAKTIANGEMTRLKKVGTSWYVSN
jgi:hypothetical protein